MNQRKQEVRQMPERTSHSPVDLAPLGSAHVKGGVAQLDSVDIEGNGHPTGRLACSNSGSAA
ncbi:hypothetical protein ABQF34_24115 [Mycolicibacterium boenickei]